MVHRHRQWIAEGRLCRRCGSEARPHRPQLGWSPGDGFRLDLPERIHHQITVFNAPGFLDDADNRTFFALLGGAIPAGANTLNVIADEANVGLVPWSGIAGKHSRPGTAIDIPIENQWRGDEPNPTTGAWNHSQQILTDALAVHATLAKLDPNLSTTTFKPILQATAVGTSASLERIIDVLEKFFGINSTPLPTGNTNRDALYQALYGLHGNELFKASHGRVKIENLANKTADGLQRSGQGATSTRSPIAMR